MSYLNGVEKTLGSGISFKIYEESLWLYTDTVGLGIYKIQISNLFKNKTMLLN